jgi:hypothetical protein
MTKLGTYETKMEGPPLKPPKYYTVYGKMMQK